MIGAGVAARSIHGAKVCVIPRPENNYRPLALRRGPMALASALLIAAKVLAITTVALMPASAELSTITTARIIEFTNQARRQAGLNELASNPVLAKAAAAKAADMIAEDYFAHISPAGVTPWFWMHKAGYTYRVAGENLAIDFTEAEDVVAAWMASSSHKDNIMQAEYTETGVAVLTGEYQGGTSTVVVHMFGRPLQETTAPAQVLSTQEEPAPVTTEETDTPRPSIQKPQINPPRAPIISMGDNRLIVQQELPLIINSEAGTRVTVLINDREAWLLHFNATQDINRSIPIEAWPDGMIRITAFAKNSNGLQSEKSTELVINKDTTAPEITKEDLVVIWSPQIDRPKAVVLLPDRNWRTAEIEGRIYNQEDGRIARLNEVTASKTFKFADETGNVTELAPIELLPSFYQDRAENPQAAARQLNRTTRRLALGIFIIVACLLVLAVLIKIKIQHPRMILQASLVLLLAALGILW